MNTLTISTARDISDFVAVRKFTPGEMACLNAAREILAKYPGKAWAIDLARGCIRMAAI